MNSALNALKLKALKETHRDIGRGRTRAGTRVPGARRIFALALSCLFMLACPQQETRTAVEPTQADPGPVALAWVDGGAIHVQDLLLGAHRGPAPEGREQQLEAAVLARLTVLEAERRGLDQRPEILQRIERTRTEALRREFDILREALEGDMMREVEVSEEELLAGYEEDDRSYNEPQLKYREWTFPTEAAARAALEANALEASAARDLPLVSIRASGTEATPQLHHLGRPGDRAVIGQEDSWRVVEFVAIVDDAKLPFEEVRESVRRRLELKKMESAFEAQLQALRDAADVRFNESALANDALWLGAADAR